MNNYKITIQYDGTRYKGWQGQNSTGLTIQGKIEAVLGQMAGHAVEVIGSGRTDAGVHAFGVGYGEREYLRHDVAPYTSGRHARRRPFRTSYGLILEKTKNRNLSIPVVCAPAGIRTLDTLIKSQLL